MEKSYLYKLKYSLMAKYESILINKGLKVFSLKVQNMLLDGISNPKEKSI